MSSAVRAFERIVKKLKKFTTNAARSGTMLQLTTNWPAIATITAAAASSRSTPNSARMGSPLDGSGGRSLTCPRMVAGHGTWEAGGWRRRCGRC
jgi:hypothetical protein